MGASIYFNDLIDFIQIRNDILNGGTFSTHFKLDPNGSPIDGYVIGYDNVDRKLKQMDWQGNLMEFNFGFATGSVGPQGPQGPKGSTGPQGIPGPTGPQGNLGFPGPQGNKGSKGDIGPTGPTGPTGSQGIPGAIGATGPKGDIGPTGPTGPQGPQGNPGPVGSDGTIGPIGPTGSQGLQGIDGALSRRWNYKHSTSSSPIPAFTQFTLLNSNNYGTDNMSDAEKIRISNVDSEMINLQNLLMYLLSWSNMGTEMLIIQLTKSDDNSIFGNYVVSNVNSSTNYFEFKISNILSSNGTLSSNDEIVISFSLTGKKGDPGQVSLVDDSTNIIEMEPNGDIYALNSRLEYSTASNVRILEFYDNLGVQYDINLTEFLQDMYLYDATYSSNHLRLIVNDYDGSGSTTHSINIDLTNLKEVETSNTYSLEFIGKGTSDDPLSGFVKLSSYTGNIIEVLTGDEGLYATAGDGNLIFSNSSDIINIMDNEFKANSFIDKEIKLELSNSVKEDISKGMTAYSWGNHATASYLKEISHTESNTIILSGNGTDNDKLKGDVKISDDLYNIIESKNNGLYANPISHMPIILTNSDEDLEVGDIIEFAFTRTGTITEIRAAVVNPPTENNLEVNINIYNNINNNISHTISILDGNRTASSGTFSNNVTFGDIIKVKIAQIGSATAGSGLTLDFTIKDIS